MDGELCLLTILLEKQNIYVMSSLNQHLIPKYYSLSPLWVVRVLAFPCALMVVRGVGHILH